MINKIVNKRQLHYPADYNALVDLTASVRPVSAPCRVRTSNNGLPLFIYIRVNIKLFYDVTTDVFPKLTDAGSIVDREVKSVTFY